MRRTPWHSMIGALALVLVAALTMPSRGQERGPTWAARTASFDRDPKWDGARNRVKRKDKPVKQHDFGYRTSNHAGAKAGEIGGVVWRSVGPAYYAKRIDPLTFDDPMSCSGTLSLVHAPGGFSGYQNGSTIFVGFFNHKEQGWRPVNFIGFRLEGYNEPDGAPERGECHPRDFPWEASQLRRDISSCSVARSNPKRFVPFDQVKTVAPSIRLNVTVEVLDVSLVVLIVRRVEEVFAAASVEEYGIKELTEPA